MINISLILCALLATGSVFGMEQKSSFSLLEREMASKKASLKLDIMIHKFGLGIDRKDKGGKSLLRKMFDQDEVEIDEPLLEEFKRRGGNINEVFKVDTHEMSALCLVIYSYNRVRIKALIACGADLKWRSQNGTSAFYALCGSEDYEADVVLGEDIIALFIAYGEDINSYSEHCYTPLRAAITMNRWNIWKQLLKHGADPFPNDLESNALFYAVRENYQELQSFFVRLWFSRPRKPYLMATLLVLRPLATRSSDMRNKILSFFPEFLPDHSLPKFYSPDVAGRITAERDAEKLSLIEEIKACLNVNKDRRAQ